MTGIRVRPLAGVALVGPTTANAELPTAVVAMGDSFISGEAAGQYTDGNGCHRSAVAEIEKTAISGISDTINLACSGAKIANITTTGFKGEAPQLQQLDAVLDSRRVRMVVLTVIANDVGFADIVTACATRFVTGLGPCYPSQDVKVRDGLAANQARLTGALDEVHALMQAHGYAASDYQLVLQTYASPLHRTNRYSTGWRSLFGCPYYDADHRWAFDTAVPRFSTSMKSAAYAATRGPVRVLDLNGAFAGREVCASGATIFNEWVRGIDFGDLQQSMHPNARGHAQMGRCLTQFYALASTDGRCLRGGDGNLTAVAVTR